jgi:hypothetical protein
MSAAAQRVLATAVAATTAAAAFAVPSASAATFVAVIAAVTIASAFSTAAHTPLKSPPSRIVTAALSLSLTLLPLLLLCQYTYQLLYVPRHPATTHPSRMVENDGGGGNNGGDDLFASHPYYATARLLGFFLYSQPDVDRALYTHVYDLTPVGDALYSGLVMIAVCMHVFVNVCVCALTFDFIPSHVISVSLSRFCVCVCVRACVRACVRDFIPSHVVQNF